MYNLVNTNFNRTYNPIGNRNALSDIKRLLTSRDTVAQTRACGYIAEVIKRYHANSTERARMIEYLLDNDIIVFLCEATTTLSLSLFRIVLECIRLLWINRRFFDEEHAANAMAAVLRSLSHYSATDTSLAVDCCLHFLCDLLNGIRVFEATSVLSYQSPYNVEQLLACMHDMASRICANHKAILSSALVLHSLIAYQPNNLDLRTSVVSKVFEVISQWVGLLVGCLKQKVLVDDEEFGMFLVVLSQIGIDTLRLLKLLDTAKPTNFIQSILADDEEVESRTQSVGHMRGCIVSNICEVVVLVKENQDKIKNDEYSVFLKFLLAFLSNKCDVLADFCDVLLTNGYLAVLPQYQILRNDRVVRKVSTLVLGELLKVLTEKYLLGSTDSDNYATDIQMGLLELQNGVEKPDVIGSQLQKSQPYSLLIYIYFYCQSTDQPEDCTASLLPHLVDHVLGLPKNMNPPAYIIKALWLVFAMSTISNGTLASLDERVRLDQATDIIVRLLHPSPSVLYTHHPAILLWTYTSQRIPYTLRLNVLSQWLSRETSLPEDLSKDSSIWELLLNVLIHNTDKTTLSNCIEALNYCLDQDENSRLDFASHTWAMLPNVLSSALIDPDNIINPNICYLLELASSHKPASLEQADCNKISVLITTLFSKSNSNCMDIESRVRYEHASLKLCLMLLQISQEHEDDRVLLTVVNRVGFLPAVLTATESVSDDVACTALQLLSYTVVCYTKNKYQAKSILQLQTKNIIQCLRKNSTSVRGTALLHLIHSVLSSAYTPLVLTYHIQIVPCVEQQCNALHSLLFRVQLTLCCQNIDNQSPTGWKALNSIFKHAIVYRNDPKLVAILSTQPWSCTLIRFQLTQPPTKEFLIFTLNWLTLLKITLSKSKNVKKVYISKYSLTRRTLVLIRKSLKDEDEECRKVVMISNEILNDCNVDE